ncbi:MAG: glycosyltransferase family 2 protein [Bacteroidales bacterium]
MDISIIIVNYNVKQFVLDCLASIYKNNDSFEIEIIIIDNNSTDGSIMAIKENYPNVTLIENDFNAGFPAANNQGFKIAKGKYIFMLNPDTEITDFALSKLYNYMEANPVIDLIAPMLLNSDMSLQLSVWRYPSLWNIFCEMHYLKFFLGNKNYIDKDFSLVFEAESFSGAAIFFKKVVFDKIGMLDETMFWIEDVDFCYRAKQAGLKLIYYPNAKVLHHIGQSAKKNYKVSLSNQVFNKIKFYKKYKSKIKYLSVLVLSIYHVFVKLIIFSILSPTNKIYWRKAKAYFYIMTKILNPAL